MEPDRGPGSGSCSAAEVVLDAEGAAQRSVTERSSLPAAAAEASAGLVHEKMLEWMNYLLLDNMSYCDSLIMMPENASQYLTTLECGESISYDVNNDGLIKRSDLTSLMISCLMFMIKT